MLFVQIQSNQKSSFNQFKVIPSGFFIVRAYSLFIELAYSLTSVRCGVHKDLNLNLLQSLISNHCN